MSVAQPEILLVLNDSSGTTVTNDGSVATDPTIDQGVEDTDWSWNTGLGSWDGYLQSLDEAGSDQFWMSMQGVAMPSTLDHLWGAMAFNVTAYDTRASARGYLKGPPKANEVDGNILLRVENPTSTGDFNLRCKVATTNGLGGENVYEDLNFSQDYQIVIAIDTTTVSASQAKFLLDGGSVIKPATQNLTSAVWSTTGGWLGRGSGFSNYYGIAGKLYYFAMGHGTLLSDTDMSDINTDPAGTITGWPSAGGGATLVPPIIQNYRNMGVMCL